MSANLLPRNLLPALLLIVAACRPLTPLPGPAPAAEQIEQGTSEPSPSPALLSPGAHTATAAPDLSAPITPATNTPTSPATEPPPTETVTTAPSPTPCATPGRVEQSQLESPISGSPVSYRIYLPPCYGMDGRVYPVLYLFSGNIHNEGFWDSLGLDEAAEAMIIDDSIPPFLVVFPDNGWLAKNTTSGPRSFEGFVLTELIPHIEANYCAWAARQGRAVGGVSRGGYWSLMMAFRRPDLFRSVAGHSPALIDSHAGPAEDPVVTGAVNELGDLRIYADIGENDPYLRAAMPLHDALSAAGVAHEWYLNSGNHDEAYWIANLNAYLQWYGDGWTADRSAMPDCSLN